MFYSYDNILLLTSRIDNGKSKVMFNNKVNFTKCVLEEAVRLLNNTEQTVQANKRNFYSTVRSILKL